MFGQLLELATQRNPLSRAWIAERKKAGLMENANQLKRKKWIPGFRYWGCFAAVCSFGYFLNRDLQNL